MTSTSRKARESFGKTRAPGQDRFLHLSVIAILVTALLIGPITVLKLIVQGALLILAVFVIITGLAMASGYSLVFGLICSLGLVVILAIIALIGALLS